MLWRLLRVNFVESTAVAFVGRWTDRKCTQRTMWNRSTSPALLNTLANTVVKLSRAGTSCTCTLMPSTPNRRLNKSNIPAIKPFFSSRAVPGSKWVASVRSGIFWWAKKVSLRTMQQVWPQWKGTCEESHRGGSLSQHLSVLVWPMWSELSIQEQCSASQVKSS